MLSDADKLVRAAARGEQGKVKQLLKKLHVDCTIACEDVTGITALQQASTNGHVGVARLLLKAKAAVDLRCGSERTEGG